MTSNEILLELKDVKSSYGKVNVLRDLSFRLYQGESLAILGRNGVGKTSTLKTIMGLLKCQSGTIQFEGKLINTISPYQIPRMGVGYVPQGRGLFPNLTVKENLYLGYKKECSPDLSDYIFERFPRLKERLNQQAGTLSGGEQQMLSIARILLIHPKIILLDEPTEGIMPILVSEIREEIKRINGAGIGILLVEQNVQTAIRLCSRILVMDKGSIIFETKTDDVRSNPEILHEHLGMHV
ncbi:ABC transporter ATP-binding protein [Polynucleobacter sp. Adler-ghost]|uniref:ABC transporter ATP-binding protein n=1 Tax=Polynucleobacter sp. Adler-ghost TaxID=2770234 RepID=UPI001BFD6C92|nr:ABC transporter ATP-binding protein [Polynucleobacter sp. Adler-ghost]QWE30397.1 ABC transporter ATP-binding protein [Polynucleobacter sp. Adler-ghost]